MVSFVLLICSQNRSAHWRIYIDSFIENLIVYRLSELLGFILILAADFNELALRRKRAKPIPEILYCIDDNYRSI